MSNYPEPNYNYVFNVIDYPDKDDIFKLDVVNRINNGILFYKTDGRIYTQNNFVFDNNKIGLGTNSPASIIDIKNNNAIDYLRLLDSSNNYKIYINSSGRLAINSSSNDGYDLRVSGTARINTLDVDSISINSNLNIQGNLIVSGNSILNNITGVSDLNISGSSTLNLLTVSSNSILNGITGVSNLNISGSSTLNLLTVSGGSILNNITGVSNLNISGNTRMEGSLTVSGFSTLRNTNIIGNLGINQTTALTQLHISNQNIYHIRFDNVGGPAPRYYKLTSMNYGGQPVGVYRIYGTLCGDQPDRGASVIDVKFCIRGPAGDAPFATGSVLGSTGSRANILIYRNTTTSTYDVYLFVNFFCLIDINIQRLGANAPLSYDGTYITTEPTGVTLAYNMETQFTQDNFNDSILYKSTTKDEYTIRRNYGTEGYYLLTRISYVNSFINGIRINGLCGGDELNRGNANIDLFFKTKNNNMDDPIIYGTCWGQVVDNYNNIVIYKDTATSVYNVYLRSGFYVNHALTISKFVNSQNTLLYSSTPLVSPVGTLVYNLSSNYSTISNNVVYMGPRNNFGIGIATPTAGLHVSNTSILVNAVTLSSTLNVNGLTNLNNTNVSGTTILNNATTLMSSLNVSGLTNLNNINISGTSVLNNATTLMSSLNVSGTTVLNNATTLMSSLNVSGTTVLNNATTLMSSLNVSGNAVIYSSLTIGTSLYTTDTDLLTINSARAWAFYQSGSDASTRLGLRPLVDGKVFQISTQDKTKNLVEFNATNSLSSSNFTGSIVGIGTNANSAFSLNVSGNTNINGNTTITSNLNVSGNVGIGAVVPSSKLEIFSNTVSTDFIICSSAPPSTTKDNLFKVSSDSGGNCSVSISDAFENGSGNPKILLNSTGNSFILTNVGIGISNPSTTLFVSGTSTLIGASTIGSTLNVSGSTNLNELNINNNLNVSGSSTFNSIIGNSLTVTTSSTLIGALNVSGLSTFNNVTNIKRVGQSFTLEGTASSGPGSHCYMAFFPNTTASSRRGYFGFGSDDTVNLSLFNQNPTGSLIFGTSSLTRMTIDSGGEVGIGLFPSAMLHVSGNAIITNGVSMNGTLNVSGLTTINGSSTIMSSLNVSGLTNLNNINISGTTTFNNATTMMSTLSVSGNAYFNSNVDIDNDPFDYSNLTINFKTGTVDIPNSSWRSICWSPDLKIFVAVGSNSVGVNQIINSYDGINWNLAKSVPNSSLTLTSVIWINGRFIACALNGTASTDRIIISDDGLTWYNTSTLSVSNTWKSLAYSYELNRIVCCADTGASGRIIYSNNGGVTWALGTGYVNTASYSSVAYSPNNKLFVVVATSASIPQNFIYTSPDGITWTTSTITTAYQFESICWASYPINKFVIVCSTSSGSQRVLYSSDGFTWTFSTSSPTIPLNTWKYVTYNNYLNTLIAVSSDGTNRVMTSTDANTWTSINVGTTNNFLGIAFNESKTLLISSNANFSNNIVSSTNLTTYAQITNSGLTDSYYNGVDYNSSSNKLIACASLGTTRVIQSTNEGLRWTTNSLSSSYQWLQVIYAGNKWVAVNSATSIQNEHIAYSSNDGVSWSFATLPANNDWSCVAYSPTLNRYVSLSFTGTTRVMYSSDAITWISTSASIIANNWTNIKWIPELSLFYAIAQNTVGTTRERVAYSSTGLTWSYMPTSFTYTNNWVDIAYSSLLNRFVLISSDTIGLNAIITSQDGLNWANANLNGAFAYTGWVSIDWSPDHKKFIMCNNTSTVGADRLLYSSDAFNWYKITVNIPDYPFRFIKYISSLKKFLLLASSGADTYKRFMFTYEPTDSIDTACLRINNNTKGVLLPSISDINKTLINYPIEGLTIYNNDQKALNVYDGVNWVGPTFATIRFNSTNDRTINGVNVSKVCSFNETIIKPFNFITLSTNSYSFTVNISGYYHISGYCVYSLSSTLGSEKWVDYILRNIAGTNIIKTTGQIINASDGGTNVSSTSFTDIVYIDAGTVYYMFYNSQATQNASFDYSTVVFNRLSS